MRKRLYGRLLSVVLSATLALSPSLTAFAADEGAIGVPENTETTTDGQEDGEKSPEQAEPEEEDLSLGVEEEAADGETSTEETEPVEGETGEVTEEVTEEPAEEATEENAELTEQAEEESDLMAEKDVTIAFTNTTSDDNKVELYQVSGDGSIANENIIATGASSGNGNVKPAASEEDYSFYIKPITAGYQLAEDPITVTWTDYSSQTARANDGTGQTGVINEDYEVKNTGNDEWDEEGIKKVTIKSSLLREAYNKSFINADTPTQSTHANKAKIAVNAKASVAKVIYLSFDLTKASDCSMAIAEKDTELRYEYSAATDNWSITLGNNIVTGLNDPDSAKYTIIQTGSDNALKDDGTGADKTSYDVIVKETDYESGDLDGTVNKMAEYDKTTNKLYIHHSLVKIVATTYGRALQIAVDTTKTTAPKYTSIALADPENYAKFASFGEIPSNKGVDENVAITAEAKNIHRQTGVSGNDAVTESTPARKIDIKYSVDGGITKVGTADESFSQSSNTWTLAANTFTEAKDLKFYLESTEAIMLAGTGNRNTNYTIVGQSSSNTTNTTALLSPVSGETYSFKVTPKGAGNTITKVVYRFGSSEEDIAATKSLDGTWSATTAAVEDTLTVYVTVKTDNNKYDVKLDNSAMDALATVTGVKTSTSITSSSKSNEATDGEKYTFTVTPKAGKFVSKVEYKIGTLGTKTEISPVKTDEDGVSTYETSSIVNDNLTIYLTGVNGYKLTAPANKNVVIKNKDGIALAPGQSIYVDGSKEYKFSASLASGVSGVTFKSIGNASSDTAYSGTNTTGAGSWTIPAGTDNVVLKAVTEQVVPRNLFQVGWYPDGEDGTLSNTEDLKLTRLPLNTAKNDYDFTTNKSTGTTDSEQSLILASGETIYIKAKFKQNASVNISSDTEANNTTKIKLKNNAATSSIATLANNQSKNILVTATKAGENTLVAEIKVTDAELGVAGSANTGNTLIYHAELPITVTEKYSSFRAVATNNATYNKANIIEGIRNYTDSSNNDVYFFVLGTNGRTLKEDDTQAVSVTDSISKITWVTTPDVDGVGDPDFTLATNGTNSIHASAAKASVTKITATPTIWYNTDPVTSAEGTYAEVKVTGKATYVAYPEVSIKNGITDTYVTNNENYTIAKTGAMSGLEVEYKVYRQTVETLTTTITDEETLAAAIAKGELEIATLDKGSPVFTVSNSDSNTDLKYYATGEPDGSKFSVTPNKVTGSGVTYNIKMDAKIDGVAVDSKTIKVAVKNEMDPVSVTLRIVDTDAKTESKVNRQVLSTDPSFVGNETKVLIEKSDSDGTSDGTGTTYGVRFNYVSSNSTFTLPGKKDFDKNAFGAGRIPYGWVYDINGSKVYYELGATNVPVGDGTKEFELLWADEYSIAPNGSPATGIYNKNDLSGTATYPSSEDLAKNNTVAGINVATNLTIDGEIPVVLRTEQVTGIWAKGVAATSTEPAHAAGDKKIITTYIDNGFTLSAKSESPEGVFKNTTTSGTERNISGTSIIGQYTGTGVVTATWKAPDDAEKSVDTGMITIGAKKSLTIEALTTNLNSDKALELTAGTVGKILQVQLKNNKETTGVDWANYKYEVTVGSTAIVTKGTVAKNSSAYILDIPLKGVTEGNTTVTITAKDNQGNMAYVADTDGGPTTSTQLTVNVIVSASKVSFVASRTVNNKKKLLDKVELSVAEAAVGGVDFGIAGYKTQDINIQAFASSDTEYSKPLTGGSWTVAGDGTVVASTLTSGDDGKGGLNVTVAKKATDTTTFGSGKVTFTFTPNGGTESYEYVLDVNTYKPVVLEPGYDNTNASADVTILDENGKAVETLNEDGSHKTYDPVILKVFKDGTTPADEKYVVDLKGYTAKYADGSAKEFEGWAVSGYEKKANTDYATESVDLTTGSDILGGTSSNHGFNSDKTIASAVLHPVFGNTAIKSIEFIDLESTDIVLNDSVVTASGSKAATTNIKLNIRVTDANSKDTIDVYPSKVGMFALTSGDGAAYAGYDIASASATAAGKIGVTASSVNAEKNTRTDIVVLGMVKGATGSTVLTFKSNTSGEVLGTLNLTVNGAKYNRENIVGYTENGESIKSDVRTVDGNSIYMDETGAALTASGPVYVSSLAKYVLVNRVTGVKHVPYGKGKQQLGGKTYYVTDGTTGEIVIADTYKVDGVERLFRENGTMVSFTDSDVIDGEITVDGVDYVIDPETNEAMVEHGHKWESQGFVWAEDWKSATISFKCTVGEKEEVKGPFNATVTPEVATDYTKYTASYTFDEVEYTETKYVNANGEEFVPHDGDHDWKDSWVWSQDHSSVVLTLTCNKGKYSETKTFTITDIDIRTFGSVKVYTATYKLDDKNTFTNSESVTGTGEESEVKPVIVDDETGLVIDGIDDEFIYDGTKKEFKNLKVYWNDSILVEGTDYKLTYANNINAGDHSATVTIKGMGQYEANVSEVIEFSIEKADFDGDYSYVYPKDYKWTTSLLTGTKVSAPAIMYREKALDKKLYTITFEDGAKIALGQKAAKAGIYKATVAPSALGAANFTGSAAIYFEVADAANTVLADKLTITPSVTAISKSDGVVTPAKVTYTVKYKGVTLSAEDFESMFEATTDEYYSAGSFNPTVTANEGAKIGNYNVVGSKKVKVTVKGTNLSTVKNAFASLDKKSVPYTGEEWEYKDILEYLGIEGFSPLEYGTDYYVDVTNNLKKGTMKVKFSGTGIYQGSVTKNVPIRALTEDEYTISINGENYDKSATDLITVPYTAGGAVVKDLKVYALDGFLLREGVDYTVSYKNNKTVNGTATLTINGKKNYGKGTVKFKVGTNDGGESAVYSLPTEVASAAKADGKKAPAIYDEVTGKKLTAGKDFTYSYATSLEDNTLKVTIKNGSLGTYDFGESGIELDGYHVFQTAITNKLVSVKGTYYYTGTAITLNSVDEFSGLELGKDFVVIGYKNNIKAGNAKVTIRGIGNYGKTATLTFKINKATVKSN